jgi:hypothetical protein
MFAKIFPATLGVALLIAPTVFAQDNRKPSPARQNTQVRESREVKDTEESRAVQEAIAFERHKDEAAARQLRMEARHPSVTHTNADRSADRESPEGRVMKDEKAPKK